MRKKQQETEKEQPGKQGAIKEEWCPPNQMLLRCQVTCLEVESWIWEGGGCGPLAKRIFMISWR